MERPTVIDADGHVLEDIPAIRELLEPRWRRQTLVPLDAWDRRLHNRLGQDQQTPPTHLSAMDLDGIDVMVLYPTLALSAGTLREVEYAAALSRAYNSWVATFCAADTRRLKF